jgi:ubiquitin
MGEEASQKESQQCFYCHKEGHDVAQCPEAPERIKQIYGGMAEKKNESSEDKGNLDKC